MVYSVNWSGRRRLQREQRELKAPQERSDEEIEAVPAESVRLKRKSTLFGFLYLICFYEIDSNKKRRIFFANVEYIEYITVGRGADMFVKSVMIPKEKCVTVLVDTTVSSALLKLEEKEMDALPILDNGKYVGMFNKYLLYKAYFYSNLDKEAFMEQTKVTDIMTNEDIFVSYEDVFENAMIKLHDFPVLAVVEDGKFLGLVTRYDAVEQFKSAFGMNTKGTRITFTSVESEGRIQKMTDVLHKYHASVISIVTFDETDKLFRRIVLKIENDSKIDRILSDLEKSGFRVLHINKEE